MPTYNPADALTLTVREVVTARQQRLAVGETLLHMASAELAQADNYAALAIANAVVDPIPFYDVPPRSLRKTSVWVGKTLSLPEGLL